MTGPRRVTATHPLGDVGLLVELADLEQVLALDAAVRARRDAAAGVFAELVDVVPAAVTVMLTMPPGSDLGGLAAAVRQIDLRSEDPAHAAAAGEVIQIQVRYDGEDLPEVARRTGLTEQQVIAAHTGTTWRAAFGGFAPGFFYLVPVEHTKLDVPRRDEPRTAVPAGAVALAGTYSAVYPRSSPGGWQLIGGTKASMWDVARDTPSLLSPGQRVRFVEEGAGT